MAGRDRPDHRHLVATVHASKPAVRRALGLAAAFLLSTLTATSPASGAGIEVMPVEQIRPGMKGHAVTVFHGDATDRFEIEIVDVVRNYLPNQDAILFKSPDPRLVHSGIVGGMSGSPIFIDGKLVGALAYGYRFNKDPLGGITPIANMLDVGKLPPRPDVLPTRRARARDGARGWADAMLGLNTSPLPARRRPDDVDEVAGLTPLSLPLSIGGMGNAATRMLADAFGMAPARGGSTSPGEKGRIKTSWKPGDSVSVVLIDGDNSVAPNGTVTHVEPGGKNLLAFGHPMFGDGPTNLPFADARVHTIIASLDRSVKISSARTIHGAMVQDRQAAIALRTDIQAPLIPVTTRIVTPDPDIKPRSYANRIAVNVDITPNLVGALLADAVEEGGRDATDVVVDLHHEFDVETSKGPRTVKVVEEAFFPQGVVPQILARSRGVMIAAAMLDNDFEVARIRQIRQNVNMEYGAPLESIMEVRLPSGDVRAGDIVDLEVVLRAYKGTERTEKLRLRIPADAANEEIQIQVTGGDFVRPYRPIPNSVDDLLDNLEQWYPARSMVASIYRESEGLSTRYGLLTQLPDSVLETLTTGGSTQEAIRLKQLARRVIPTKNIIEGEHTIKLDVLPPKSFERR